MYLYDPPCTIYRFAVLFPGFRCPLPRSRLVLLFVDLIWFVLFLVRALEVFVQLCGRRKSPASAGVEVESAMHPSRGLCTLRTRPRRCARRPSKCSLMCSVANCFGGRGHSRCPGNLPRVQPSTVHCKTDQTRGEPANAQRVYGHVNI